MQRVTQPAMKRVTTDVLDVAYEAHGNDDGWPVVLLHGFPYDVRAYDEVAPVLAAEGARVIVPYLRGYGQTTFRSPTTLRSGEQAALGADLLALLDALKIDAAYLAGYDWGGRAACIVSALWPGRAKGLVTCGGYNIQDIAKAGEPATPETEQRYWYQYYLHGERGRAGLARHRFGFCKLLWKLWSPQWTFDDATYERSASSFDNADFVDVVVHSYRHRYGLVAGDPAYASIEARLAAQPAITVPTVALFGNADGVTPTTPSRTRRDRFIGPYDECFLDGIGHDVPQEAPADFVKALLDLKKDTVRAGR
jgi:pimeloyl-ACP methyl ester carboxylesterase